MLIWTPGAGPEEYVALRAPTQSSRLTSLAERPVPSRAARIGSAFLYEMGSDGILGSTADPSVRGGSPMDGYPGVVGSPE